MLYQLASGEHEIEHWLSIDDGDNSLDFNLMPAFVRVVRNPRPDTLGEVWNAPFREMKGWDVCTIIADDVYPIRPGWDRGVVALAQRHEASAWQEINDPNGPGHTILTRRFIEALGGEPYTRWFPYWFDDPWLNEVHTFAFGRGIPIATDMQLAAREHGVCQGMRDLRFWVGFWIATRRLRIEQGQRLALSYGRSIVDPTQALRVFEGLDQQWEPRIPAIEVACQADQGNPTARYLRAQSRAEEWMRTNASAA